MVHRYRRGRMFYSKKVLLVLACEMHFWFWLNYLGDNETKVTNEFKVNDMHTFVVHCLFYILDGLGQDSPSSITTVFSPNKYLSKQIMTKTYGSVDTSIFEIGNLQLEPFNLNFALNLVALSFYTLFLCKYMRTSNLDMVLFTILWVVVQITPRNIFFSIAYSAILTFVVQSKRKKFNFHLVDLSIKKS